MLDRRLLRAVERESLIQLGKLKDTVVCLNLVPFLWQCDWEVSDDTLYQGSFKWSILNDDEVCAI